jgi:hypothetical protein
MRRGSSRASQRVPQRGAEWRAEAGGLGHDDARAAHSSTSAASLTRARRAAISGSASPLIEPRRSRIAEATQLVITVVESRPANWRSSSRETSATTRWVRIIVLTGQARDSVMSNGTNRREPAESAQYSPRPKAASDGLFMSSMRVPPTRTPNCWYEWARPGETLPPCDGTLRGAARHNSGAARHNSHVPPDTPSELPGNHSVPRGPASSAGPLVPTWVTAQIDAPRRGGRD